MITTINDKEWNDGLGGLCGPTSLIIKNYHGVPLSTRKKEE